jgi:hypothetical protein
MTAKVNTGSSSSCVSEIRLAREGFIRDEATRIAIDGKALGANKRSGNSSVIRPLKIFVRSVGVVTIVGLVSPSFGVIKDWSMEATAGVASGVFGGMGIGWRGGRGDKGPEGNVPAFLGESGGECMGGLTFTGLGLSGSPGLIAGDPGSLYSSA